MKVHVYSSTSAKSLQLKSFSGFITLLLFCTIVQLCDFTVIKSLMREHEYNYNNCVFVHVNQDDFFEFQVYIIIICDLHLRMYISISS